ncbi:hypothetical protein LC653_44195 [Nostoc sp. CHAB 5784]|uniref:hypothetical protein n=1 Tax=Nostoc mirabile TaxID=2907820 RepID=UPI001E2B17E5|nr:hypothetical protein [Nostoc mirabile]MCC5670592.1 hypothetical protein [Nostoc mirabile CHAB5784]
MEPESGNVRVMEQRPNYLKQIPPELLGANLRQGCNPKQQQAWLWVAVTPLVTFFEIALTRCTQAEAIAVFRTS